MTEDLPRKGKEKSPLFKAGVAALVGLEMGAAVAVGLWFGSFLDKKLNSYPWMTIVFFVLGVAAGFRLLIQRLRILK